jgi:hypothetical protein
VKIITKHTENAKGYWVNDESGINKAIRQRLMPIESQLFKEGDY